jgi:hypothetical protein
MTEMNEFDNILDECLQRLLKGESIESCLARYPQYASELEPLLRTAHATLKAADIKPRPEFRDRARYQFQAALREMPAKEKHGFFSFLQPGMATVIGVAIVLLAGGATVAAAGSSLPGGPLYQVKLATESVRLALTPSELGKAALNASFADERVDEIVRMAENGDADLIEETTDRMNQNLLAVANLNVTGGAIREDMHFSAMNESAFTRAPVATAAPTATPSAEPLPTPTPAPQIATPAPTVKITTPPPDDGLSGLKHGLGIEEAAGDDMDSLSAEQKLRDTLLRQAEENLRDLQEQLEKAPEFLKPALRHAIEVAARAYDEALAMLDS